MDVEPGDAGGLLLMNRRSFLKILGAAGLVAAAPIIPQIVLPTEEQTRRFWRLDSTMLVSPEPPVLGTIILPWFDAEHVLVRNVKAVVMQDGENRPLRFDAPESGLGVVRNRESGVNVRFDNGKIVVELTKPVVLDAVVTSYANKVLIDPNGPLIWFAADPTFDHAAVWLDEDLHKGTLPVMPGMRGWR